MNDSVAREENIKKQLKLLIKEMRVQNVEVSNKLMGLDKKYSGQMKSVMRARSLIEDDDMRRDVYG